MKLTAAASAVLIALALSGCFYNFREETDDKGRRKTKVVPGMVLYGGPPDRSICPFELNLNHQCYPTLAACRAAGDLRYKYTPHGYTCTQE